MRRPPYLLILIVALGLILAACASPSAGGPGASGGGEPSAAASTGTEPSQGDGGGGNGGGGGGGIGTTLPDGQWTGGDAHADLSGDTNASFDATLLQQTSFTAGDSTTLFYVDSSGGNALAVAIYSDSFAVSVTTTDGVAGGGTTTTCDVTYHSTEANNISGDFSCPDSPSVSGAGVVAGSVDIEGSFSATR